MRLALLTTVNGQVLALALAFLLATSTAVRAENWPQWRGPGNDGISHENGLPVEFGPSKNVAWRLPLPGPAGATPVVWNDRIFLASTRGEELVLLCISTTGEVQWDQVVSRGDKTVRGDEGNSASPSPCTDGQHVWATMADGVMGCYDMDGQQVWKLSLPERYGPLDITFGMTSTPVLDGDRLYLQLLHSKAKLIIALDKATGDEVWRHERPSDAYAECEQVYASPVLYRDAKRAYLLAHGADYITAHRLEDGAEIWRCGGINPKNNYNPTLRLVASPVAVPGLIIAPSAKNGPVLALSPDAVGDITESQEGHVWTRPDNTPDVPSPLVYEGLVYLCREDGVLLCLDATTGDEIYRERCFPDRYRASPVYGDGKIYVVARTGVVTVIEAGRNFKVLAENDMKEAISSSPVVSGGRIYLRSFEALYAVEATGG